MYFASKIHAKDLSCNILILFHQQECLEVKFHIILEVCFVMSFDVDYFELFNSFRLIVFGASAKRSFLSSSLIDKLFLRKSFYWLTSTSGDDICKFKQNRRYRFALSQSSIITESCRWINKSRFYHGTIIRTWITCQN